MNHIARPHHNPQHESKRTELRTNDSTRRGMGRVDTTSACETGASVLYVWNPEPKSPSPGRTRSARRYLMQHGQVGLCSRKGLVFPCYSGHEVRLSGGT